MHFRIITYKGNIMTTSTSIAASAVKARKPSAKALKGAKPVDTVLVPATETNQVEESQQAPSTVIGFALQQLTTPVVVEKVAPTPEELAAYQVEMAALAARFPNVVAAKPAKIPRAPKDEKNGITHPAAGTKCALVWQVADENTTSTTPAAIAQLKADVRLYSMNEHTIKTQYARWRQYHGVTGRVTVSKASTVVMTHDGNP